MTTKTKSIIGWILSGLLAAFIIFVSAGGKFADWEGKEEMFAKMGFTSELMTKIGVVEVLVTLLILIPRTSFIGGLLLTAYLGGATVTHVRVVEPFYFPIIIGIILWIALGLRNPEIFALAFGKKEALVKDAS